jgi:hypothetical protein
LGRESVIGWNFDLLKKSTFLDTDYLMMTTIEAYSQYRYLQESPKTPTYFWITTRFCQIAPMIFRYFQTQLEVTLETLARFEQRSYEKSPPLLLIHFMLVFADQDLVDIHALIAFSIAILILPFFIPNRFATSFRNAVPSIPTLLKLT